MSRRRVVIREAALGYASRGIPILPLHYPLARPNGFQPVGGSVRSSVQAEVTRASPENA